MTAVTIYLIFNDFGHKLRLENGLFPVFKMQPAFYRAFAKVLVVVQAGASLFQDDNSHEAEHPLYYTERLLISCLISLCTLPTHCY